VHLKTAGTSYLEALRVFANTNSAFFRQILHFAIREYETERKTYHVSASLAKLPDLKTLPDANLPALLDHFDARQVLHVTFGRTLETFGGEFLARIDQAENEYSETLKIHFSKHLKPFAH
jgi:hypothetical protein